MQFRNTFLMVGGRTEAGGARTDKILEFDPNVEDWIVRNEKLAIARAAHAAFLVPNNAVNCS